MKRAAQRLNITLDGERAAKLSRLAARVHVNQSKLARSLLSSALDESDPDPTNGRDVAGRQRRRVRTGDSGVDVPARRHPAAGATLAGASRVVCPSWDPD